MVRNFYYDRLVEKVEKEAKAERQSVGKTRKVPNQSQLEQAYKYLSF